MTPAEIAAADAAIKASLAEDNIYTHYVARFEFKSETSLIWTGQYPFIPSGTGDAKCEGLTFAPIASGTPYDVGSNKYSEQGSDAFEMSLAVPADLPPELQLASLDKSEYQARIAVVWRAVMTQPPGLGTPPTWLLKRIRTGRMDQLTVTQDSHQHIIKLTIEGWSSYVTDASNLLWANQQDFDAADTSQNWLSSTANGTPIPNSQPTSASVYTTGGGGGYNSYQDF